MAPPANVSVSPTGGSHTFIFPITGVGLTDAVKQEFRIKRVTLVSAEALRRRGRRLGIPVSVSQLERDSQGFKNHFIADRKTFAVVRQAGDPEEQLPGVLVRVREELAILALSQLGYSRRRSMSFPSVAGEHTTGVRAYFAIDATGQKRIQEHTAVRLDRPLVLDENWRTFQETLFFLRLVKVLNNRHRLTKEWHRDLWNAAVLAGMSQTTLDVPQAFLWNMIAVELLLTRQNDPYTEVLPARAEAMLGWAGEWKMINERIREVYQKRCLLVHRGQRQVIAPNDLLFTDDLLLNLLANIVIHIGIFSSKEAVAEFAEKVAAERLLGIRPQVRPKTLTHLKPHYKDDDYRLY